MLYNYGQVFNCYFIDSFKLNSTDFLNQLFPIKQKSQNYEMVHQQYFASNF